MSFASITRAANDPQLRARVDAAAQKEARYSDEFGDTEYGRMLIQGPAPGGFVPVPGTETPSSLMWGVAVDTEAAYETALVSGRGAPGHDIDIITDEAITAAVQANWPFTAEEDASRQPRASFVAVGMQGQVTVTKGMTATNYTVEWGEGEPGLLPIDNDGGAFAGHDYAVAGPYPVRVLDQNGEEIAGSMTLVITDVEPTA